MRIIEIAALPNGSHRNQTIEGGYYFSKLPAGLAVIPDTLDTPNFPFGDVTVDDSTPPVVQAWTPLPIPEPEPEPDPEPTQLDRVEAQAVYTAMMTDTLLEG